MEKNFKILKENNHKFVLFPTPLAKNPFYDLFKKYSKELETPNKHLENNFIIIDENEDFEKKWREL